jgi:hypothetical protein
VPPPAEFRRRPQGIGPAGSTVLNWTLGRNKYQSRESRAQVRRVLMESWDPIGVRRIDQAPDEYDRYVGVVYVMLMDQQAARQATAAYLYDIAANYMGLGNSPDLSERSDQAAELIVALRPIFRTR